MIEKIDKDDLNSIAVSVDCARYIVQDIQEGYFESLDSQDEEDKKWILWEFKRNRAKMMVVGKLIYEIQQELAQLGATR